MKIKPMQEWWWENIGEPQIVNIGFRANEMRRAGNMMERVNENGFQTAKVIIGKSKTGNRNRWGTYDWQRPNFPLIDDGVYKDKIEEYWKDKPVRFAYMNNCVGCFHRTPILLKHMSVRHPAKFDWFIDQEKLAPTRLKRFNGEVSQYAKFKRDFTYEDIKNHKLQMDLFDADFNECDSGYCGL